MTSDSTKQLTASINGADIYYELRGAGSPLLFISGAFGDAGGWRIVAGLLAQSYTVISFDRRGNSRSKPPAGWSATSLDEQADDAAALVRAIGGGPAFVYANSLGGAIGLRLLERHADLVRAAIFHEPWVVSLLEDPDTVLAPMVDVTVPFVAAGDAPGAAEAMVRLICGDDGFAEIPADQLERMRGNADTLFSIEFPGLSGPDEAAFAVPSVPLKLAVGADSPPFLTAGARRLAELIGTDLVTIPGSHVPQLTHPLELVRLVNETFQQTAETAPLEDRRTA